MKRRQEAFWETAGFVDRQTWAIQFLDCFHQRAEALVGDAVIDSVGFFSAGDVTRLLQNAQMLADVALGGP